MTVEVTGAPRFTGDISLGEVFCINTEVEAELPEYLDGGTEDLSTGWEYSSEPDGDYEELDLEEGFPTIGQYYVRGYIQSDCGSDVTNTVPVEVRDMPTVGNLTAIPTLCYGAELDPDIPQVNGNMAAITTEGWRLVTGNGPVAVTFPQEADDSWDGAKIFYLAENACGVSTF